jgi:Tol biopolymer transport system component
MRRVIRRAAVAGVLAILLTVGVATAAAPTGPRLAIVKASRSGLELLNVNPNGGGSVRLAGGGRRARPYLEFFSTVSWSADGAGVAFTGIVGVSKGDDHEPIRKIFIASADGSGMRVVPGSSGAIGPVLSPDGHTLAFTREIEREPPATVGGKRFEEGFQGSSIWTVDLLTGDRRQLTPWVGRGSYTASSFSPDGSTLLATHEGELLSEPELVALALDGSGSRRIFEDGGSAVYSPDGTRVAFLRSTMRSEENREGSSDLYVVNADGTGLRRLTHTPGRNELYPSWDPSGERLAYVRFSAAETEGSAFGVGDALMQINADGTCQTKILSSPRAAFYAPAWQPGPDRGAGRIQC